MLHDLFAWLENSFGTAHTPLQRSYSDALEQSYNFWNLLEGTHLLMLMLFFGTILIVDLRLMGVAFRTLPVSVVSKRVLSLTVISMVILVATGALLFTAKANIYYHNIWFRSKMVILILAMINVYVFHKLVQKNQEEWDTAPKTPTKAKVSAILSITFWVAIIACGRLVAYNWQNCGNPLPDWINAVQECARDEHGATNLKGISSLDPTGGAGAAPAGATSGADVFGPPAAAPVFDTPPTPAAPAAKPEGK